MPDQFGLIKREDQASAKKIYEVVKQKVIEDMMKVQASNTDKIIKAFQMFEEKLDLTIQKKVDEEINRRRKDFS